MAILLVLMGFGIAVFSYAMTFPGSSNFRSGKWMPGPGFFPQLLAIVLFLAAGIELLRYLKQRKSSATAAAEPELESGADELPAPQPSVANKAWGTQNVVLILFLMFSFPFLVERVGFALMGFLTVVLISWRLKAGLLKSAVFAAFAVTATMVFFRLVFFMDLPQGIWSPTQYIGY